MKKNKTKAILIALAVIACCTLPAFAQEEVPLTQREWNIYYDYVERGDPSNYVQLANEHGITKEELDAITMKAFDYGLTEEEKGVYGYLTDTMAAMPHNSAGGISQEQILDAERNTCENFGITKKRLDDIEVRSMAYY